MDGAMSTEGSSDGEGAGDHQQQQTWFASSDAGKTKFIPHKLACASCRHRKVRCDRRDPCSQCLRTGDKCSFPAGYKPRKKRQPSARESVHLRHEANSLLPYVSLTDEPISCAPRDEKFAEISRKLDSICCLVESFSKADLQDGASASRQIPNAALSTPRGPLNLSSDALKDSSRWSQLSESEHEGESSLSTQAAHAVKFLQDAVKSEHAIHADSPKVTQALDALRHSSQAQADQDTGTSLAETYPRAKPPLLGSGGKDATVRHMPPIEMAVACLRTLKTNPRVKFFWVLDFQSTGEFTEHLLTVYSADEAAIADQIIVNLGLYCLLVECSNVTEDDVLRAEYRSQSQLCQNNAETILSGLPFNLPLTRDCVLALSMAATYMLEICKPSAAWGFIVAASQMSQMLGFHRHALPAALGRVEAKGRSTRIFWVIYITEKMLSLRLGRPSTIRDSDISVQLTPDVLNSDNAVMPVLSKWVHLAQLHGKVYDDIYSFGALTQQENVRVSRTRSLAEDLRKLYHSQSPAEARFLEMRHQALGDSLNELFVRSHRVSYLSLLTLIYRSVPVGRATGNAAFCEECIVTARQALEEHGRCIRLLNEQTDNVVAFYVSWILLASPFVPFTVLFCHVIQTSDTTDLEHLESVVEVLKSMPHDSAETYSKQLRLFKHLYDVACRYIEIKASAQESLPDGSFERLVRESGLRLPIQPPGGDLGTQPADWASGEGFDVDLMLDHSAPGTVRAFGETQEMEFGGVELGDWYAQNHEMLRMMEDDFVGCMDERRA